MNHLTTALNAKTKKHRTKERDCYLLQTEESSVMTWSHLYLRSAVAGHTRYPSSSTLKNPIFRSFPFFEKHGQERVNWLVEMVHEAGRLPRRGGRGTKGKEPFGETDRMGEGERQSDITRVGNAEEKEEYHRMSEEFACWGKRELRMLICSLSIKG